MGIRVQKCVGYGLTNLVKDDPRLDPTGYLCASTDDQEERWTALGYRKFLEESGCIVPYNGEFYRTYANYAPFQDLVAFQLGTAGRKPKYLDAAWDPWNSVIHNTEFGLSNVLVVIPFCMALREEGGQWKRYDDIIDYCEESSSFEQKNRVVVLKNGIHPWDCDFEDLGGSHLETWEVRFRRAKGRADFRPRVPNEIRALCAYLKLFKSPETAKTMRPLLYIYWA